ncbi:hypothetical protein EV702DRAFT_1196072 [Suillus placidus]|uniref:Ndc10 domain-containing protein n=1 Tax=Suillus placidus TaxID=48579 RepID=A0A9P6ZYN9_9AGAM|nr:hypothetical protein EV702DRAFT_1196072 [Suillus placidus]
MPSRSESRGDSTTYQQNDGETTPTVLAAQARPSTPNPALAPSTVGPDVPAQSSISTQGLDEINTLAAHDAKDDIDDAGANAPESQDDDEPLVHASGQCMDAINTARAWVDKFIMSMRRKSGQQTEKSVLNIWKHWLTITIASGQVPDVIIDAHHIIEYLKCTGTHKLLTQNGGEQDRANGSLSESSLKKTIAMLGQVRHHQVDDNISLEQARPAFTPRISDFYKALMVQAQCLCLKHEDFDVTENTILDSHLFPEHFEQVKKSVFTTLTQLPSVIKAHQCWTWQCTTLNRGDELVSLPLSCIQPYKVFVPDYTTADGRRSGSGQFFFGVLSLYHKTKVVKPGKQEPDYNFVLLHKDLLKCPVGALAISLHYQFDQEGLMSKVDGWDWSWSATWREVKLMFGKHVGQPLSGDALRKMYTTMLGLMTITLKKKLHLAHHMMPSMMEDMGSVIFGMFLESLVRLTAFRVHTDEVDAIGHWEGNTHHETYAAKIPKSAVCALAGFYVREQYNVPWATTDVPAELQMQIFPFAEDALANLRQATNINYGTVNFLELLQLLHGYFWRVIAAIHQPFPDSALLKRLQVTQSSKAKMFLRQWPRAREALEATAQSDLSISSSFVEAAMQMLSHCNQLLQQIEPLSPSKNYDRARSLPVTASNAGHGTMSAVGANVCPAAEQGDASWHPPPPPAPQTGKHGACAAEGSTPALHMQPSMSPVIIVHGGCSFHVLPLSPAMPPDFHSDCNLIIPSAEAFCDPITASVPQFP